MTNVTLKKASNNNEIQMQTVQIFYDREELFKYLEGEKQKGKKGVKALYDEYLPDALDSDDDDQTSIIFEEYEI